MKPTDNVSPANRRGNDRQFPLTDQNYRSVSLNELDTRCVDIPSFGRLSRDYFAGEARRNFVVEAFVFGLMIATTIPAIVDCGRALATFVRGIGGI